MEIEWCRDEQVATAACDAVREILDGDISGELALEAVQLVADLIRTRKCNCPPQVNHRTIPALAYTCKLVRLLCKAKIAVGYEYDRFLTGRKLVRSPT